MHLIAFLLIGLLAGWIAGQFMKGRGFGLVGNLIVGVIGARRNLPRKASMGWQGIQRLQRCQAWPLVLPVRSCVGWTRTETVVMMS